MEDTTAAALKTSMEQNIKLLNRNFSQQLLFTRAILLGLILLLEAAIYLEHPAALSFWEEIALPLRLGAYMVFIVVQPYITKFFFNRIFGEYIKRLEEVLEQAR